MSDHALCDTDSDSQFTVFYTMKVTEHLRLDLGLKYITLCLSSVLPENVILPTIEHNNTKHLNTKVYNDTLHYMYITL